MANYRGNFDYDEGFVEISPRSEGDAILDPTEEETRATEEEDAEEEFEKVEAEDAHSAAGSEESNYSVPSALLRAPPTAPRPDFASLARFEDADETCEYCGESHNEDDCPNMAALNKPHAVCERCGNFHAIGDMCSLNAVGLGFAGCERCGGRHRLGDCPGSPPLNQEQQQSLAEALAGPDSFLEAIPEEDTELVPYYGPGRTAPAPAPQRPTGYTFVPCRVCGGFHYGNYMHKCGGVRLPEKTGYVNQPLFPYAGENQSPAIANLVDPNVLFAQVSLRRQLAAAVQVPLPDSPTELPSLPANDPSNAVIAAAPRRWAPVVTRSLLKPLNE